MFPVDFRRLQSRNRWATRGLVVVSFLLLALVALFVSLLTVGGLVAAVGAIAVAGAMSFAGYYSSDRLALSATGARPADPDEFRQLHNVVEEMALAAGVPTPRIYVVDDPAPNAFATGRNPSNAAVAVTTGLLAKMNRQELTGVVAHEMAHIRNLDIRVMTVAVATAGAIAIIADIFLRLIIIGGRSRGRSRRGSSNSDGAMALIALVGFVVVVVLAPLAAGLLRAAVSRSRERLADASAVELTRDPSGIRRALEKLQADVTVVQRTSHATSHLWIESPDDTQRGHRNSFVNRMFETHPPLTERIDVLRRMEGLAPSTGPDPALLAELAAVERASIVPRATASDSWTEVNRPESMMGLAPPTAAPSMPPSGWYTDPADTDQLRWWDGGRWTDHVAEMRSDVMR